MRGFDVRVIANRLLDEAKSAGFELTNLHLNKALFFMHVDCLRENGHGLISAKIEAWEHGPVFREVYGQFKRFKGGAITDRAMRVDYVSGEKAYAYDDLPEHIERFVSENAIFYARIPAMVLRDISHVNGGAWDFVWNHSGVINVGMEITEDIIREFEIPHGRRITVQ